jgi:heat shock protein 1/8
MNMVEGACILRETCWATLRVQAERHKAEDERQRERIQAKNALENYAFSLRNSLNEDELASKISAADTVVIEEAVAEVMAWLDHSGTMDKVEYERRHRELEGTANAALGRAASSGAGSGSSADAPLGGFGASGGGLRAPHYKAAPKVDEVD